MSQHEAIKKEIDGFEYSMNMMDPLRSNKLLIQVCKMIGPAVGPVLDRMVSSKGLETELDSDFISKAFTSLFQNMDSDKIEYLIKEFTKDCSVTIEGKTVALSSIFDLHFMGAIDRMYKWFIFCTQAQWGKCLGALTSTIALQSA